MLSRCENYCMHVEIIVWEDLGDVRHDTIGWLCYSYATKAQSNIKSRKKIECRTMIKFKSSRKR